MDLDEFRLILSNTGVDLWTLIGTAISVASSDYRNELKNRRDGIVEQLYALPPTVAMSRNGDLNGDRVESPKLSNETKEKHSSSLDEVKGYSPYTPQSVAVSLDDDKDYHGGSKGREVKGCSPYTPQSVAVSLDDDKEHRGGSKGRVVIEDEQSKILRIKEHLEDPNQSNDSVVDLLRTLADMDITFKALQATDIGRHVNRLRKHSSGEVRRLVKQLVRKWKDLVDEWVECGGDAPILTADGDSPQQNPPKSNQNGHYQVPDFAYSPNPNNGSSGSDKNNSEPEPKRRMIPRSEPQRYQPQKKPTQSSPVPVSSAPLPNKQKEQKDNLLDPERFASARKRLHENYLEAENAKKQRTIQVMDIKDVPKPKNSRRGGFQARHW